MAMTPPDPVQPDPDLPSGRGAALGAAKLSLRTRTDDRWVAISARVRSRALTVTRRSLSVRAQAPGGPVQVSEQVLITYVRDALTSVPDGRVDDIVILTEGAGTFTGVTLFISARYGAPLLPIADAMRDLAASRLRELLGDVAPPVTVTTMHVHVEDVHGGRP